MIYIAELTEILEDYISKLQHEDRLDAIDRLRSEIKYFDFSDFDKLEEAVKKDLQSDGHCPECGTVLDSKSSLESADGVHDMENWTNYCSECGWAE